MDMRIFVPSAGRAESLENGPLGQLPETELVRTFLVVPESEYYEYRSKSYPSVLRTPVRGIAATRHWIGRWCRDRGIRKFVMMDDDVRFVKRASETETRLEQIEDEQSLREMLSHVEHQLDDYAHVGVSARQGNNYLPAGDPWRAVAVNTRTLRVLAYRTQEFLSAEHGRVEVMEDFDVNLQLLRAGHSNINLGYWAQDQKMTNAEGGCSSYRTHEVHERSAHELARLHPGLVRLRQKKNKTDADGFGTRTEVTIQWKRAARS